MGRHATLVASDAVVLWLLHPQAAKALRRVPELRDWLDHDGADRVAVTLAATGLWGAAAWVGLGLLAAVAARLPGAGGRYAGRFAAVALPAALRRIVIGSAGLGLVLTPVTAAVAAATDAPDGPGGRPVAAAPQRASGTPLPGPSWPGSGAASTHSAAPPAPTTSAPTSSAPTTSAPTTSAPTTSAPTTSAPTTSAPTTSVPPAPPAWQSPTPTPPPAPRSPEPARTTVRADDSLWLLGARYLGSGASDAEIAAYVPDLYRANRDVIGDDPDLLRPGQRLSLPAPDSVTRAPGAS